MANINSKTATDLKLCRGCVYFMTSSNRRNGSSGFCHYLLYTGKRRVHENGVCHSKDTTSQLKRLKQNFQFIFTEEDFTTWK